MAEQLQHYNTNLLQHDLKIVIACNFITSPANLGMIFRNAEAFGVKKILLSPENASFLESNRFKKIARNTSKLIKHEIIHSLANTLNTYKLDKYSVFALELTSKSKSIQQTQFSKQVCIVLGNENYGIPATILQDCHQQIHIDLFGKNSSINVAQALGISLFELTK